MFYSPYPAKEVIAVIDRIRNTMPKMQEIWSDSGLARQGRDEELEHDLEKKDVILEGVRNGEYTLNDCVRIV